MPQQFHSFTIEHNGIARELITETLVSQPFDPHTSNSTAHPPARKYNAIWDTGATNCVITRRVINDLCLKPIGMTQVNHCGGTSLQGQYIVNIILRNNVGIPNILVTEGNLTDNADVIIGMDIICRGDFAITNKDKKTIFTFRIPSIETIDFCKQNQLSPPAKIIKSQPFVNSQPHISRNSPCPCGSGEKYKRCCGKKG